MSRLAPAAFRAENEGAIPVLIPTRRVFSSIFEEMGLDRLKALGRGQHSAPFLTRLASHTISPTQVASHSVSMTQTPFQSVLYMYRR
jgi:hypothetical protein